METYTGGWSRIPTVAGWMLLGLGGFGLVTGESRLGQVAGAVVMLICLPLMIRSGRTRLVVDDDGLTSHGVLLTTKVAWSDVADVRVDKKRTLVPWLVPVVDLRNGTKLSLDYLASLARTPMAAGGQDDARVVVDALRRRIT